MVTSPDRCSNCRLVAPVKEYVVAFAPRQPGFLQTPSRLRPHIISEARGWLCVRCRLKALRPDYLWMSAAVLLMLILAPWLHESAQAVVLAALATGALVFPIYWFSPRATQSIQRLLFAEHRERIATEAGLQPGQVLPVFERRGAAA
jgi:hypothetical protein